MNVKTQVRDIEEKNVCSNNNIHVDEMQYTQHKHVI